MAKRSTGMPLEMTKGKKSQGPTFMQALGGLLDGVTATKAGTKVPKASKNMRFGPGAGVGTPLRAEFIKPQSFSKPRGPATTGSVESPAVSPNRAKRPVAPVGTGIQRGSGGISGTRMGRSGGGVRKGDVFQAWFESQKKRNGR